MKRTLSKISILLVLLILFSACTEPDGINTGSASGGMVPPIAIRMRSDKTEFDIDDVTLDFSFGEDKVSSYVRVGGASAEKCPIVSVAVYFYNAKYIESIYDSTGYKNSKRVYKDYRKIEGWYFVKDITPEEYEQNYDVEYRWVGLPKFDHTEKDLTDNTKNLFCF